MLDSLQGFEYASDSDCFICFTDLNPVLHIETSYLFYIAKQMNGFYMKRNTGLKLFY